MTEPDFLGPSRLAIVGLGLMGGSLALALRGRCAALYGIDPDPAVRELASRLQVVDQVASDPADLLPLSDLVILAAPLRAILTLLRDLPGLHPGRAMVLDLGSTKVQVLEAMTALPERFDPLGGHPMCGKEIGGLANATPDLFRGAPFAFTPLPRTTPRLQSLVEQLAAAVGARPIWLDAQTHDLWTASTSHLPYLAAAALALSTPPEVGPLVGPGFRSTTRVAASNPAIMLDVLMTNRLPLLNALARLRGTLDMLEGCLIREEWDRLEELLDESASRQRELAAQKEATL